MIVQKENESRSSYLMRVLDAFMDSGAGEFVMNYDDTTCDGYCLAEDIKSELLILGEDLQDDD